MNAVAVPERVPPARVSLQSLDGDVEPALRRSGSERAESRSDTLMRRFQSTREGETFDELYRENRPRIERIVASCLRFGAGDLDGEEIVQDVFVSVYRSAHCFRPGAQDAFGRWSSQIARNAVRRALKDRTRRRRVGSAPLLETMAAPATNPAEREILNATAAALVCTLLAFAQSLGELIPRDREILGEADLQQAPYADIGRRHRMRPGTVRMIVFRARRRLFARVEARLFAPESIGVESAPRGDAASEGRVSAA